MIEYGRQCIEQDDIDAVTSVLMSERLTQGPRVQEFEERFADYVGAKYAVAVCNGTAALHLACLVSGMKDRVLTTPLSFVATSNAIRMAGAEPYFNDIGDDFNMTWPKQFLPKRAVVVDFAGLPCQIGPCYWPVIEDACHALGATRDGHKIGSCQESILTCFSFHPVKAITTGEGGMVTTNSANYAEHLRILRDHGRVNGECHELGYNYRMDEMSAALGISQLKKIDRFIEARKEIAWKYCMALDIPFYSNHAYHLFVILVENRDQVKAKLLEKGIQIQIHYKPIHLLPAYNTGDHFPKAEYYYQYCLSLPIYPTLKEVQHVIDCVRASQGIA